MAAKKTATHRALAPHDLGVLLEDLRSQQQAMLESIQSWGERLTRTMDERFSRVEERLDMLESAVRQNSADIQKNSADIRKNSADIAELQAEVRKLRADFDSREERAKLILLEDRVTKLEKRRAS
jgi:chromosome segregation ATPase